jgi:large subunit ribosomal protein L10
MSKFVKDHVTDQLKRELDGVQDMLLVNVIGLSANRTSALRKELRQKNIKLMVIKNSLARRATEGTQLAAAFEGSQGTLAMVWGASDIVALAKEVVRLAGIKDLEKFEARGGVMGGTSLKAEEVQQISKWPSREEQLSLLSGQILSPGARLVSQLISAGGALASQIEQRGEGEEAGAAEPAAAPEAAAAADVTAAPEA